MSGLTAALNNSVKALSADSLAINIAGKNLANINNASYSREQVVLSSGATVGAGVSAQNLGVDVTGITQLRDKVLDQQVAREIGITSALTAQQTALQNAQAGLGENITSTSTPSSITDTSNNSTGLSSTLSDFFNAFQTFAANPTDIGGRQALLQQTSILTDRFNLTDQNLAQVQSDLNTQIGSDVTSANDLLTTIANLNGQIGSLEINAPGSAVDLRDERQADIEKLAAKLPFTAAEQPNGEVQIVAKDGSGANVILVNNAVVNGTVAFNGTTITGGSPATALSLTGGSIKGELDARNGGVQAIRDNINALADQLVTSVNKAYNPTGSTGDFFDPANTTAGNITLASTVTALNLKASDTGGAAGDNTIAQAVADLATQTFSTTGSTPDQIDGTFSQYYANSISTFGQTLASTSSRLTDQQNIQQIVSNQRSSIGGVSLDEEMADLVKFQHAYQASSRIFNIVNQLMETVVTNLGSATG